MHSYHRKTIKTVEDMLDIDNQDDYDLDIDTLGLYPVQGTALLYEESLDCQEEK